MEERCRSAVRAKEDLLKNPKPLHKTNIDVVTEIMNYSRYGALAQFFVMDALLKLSDTVSKATPKEFGKTNALAVNPEAWIGVAKEIKEKLKKEGY